MFLYVKEEIIPHIPRLLKSGFFLSSLLYPVSSDVVGLGKYIIHVKVQTVRGKSSELSNAITLGEMNP